MSEPNDYSIEQYGHGFIVADYSGNRGKFGAAYTGSDLVWRSQPLGFGQLFPTEQAAREFISKLCADV